MTNKYAALTDFLSSLDEDIWHAPFVKVEDVLGFSLPRSARQYAAWWSNNRQSSRHTRSWLDAGWRTEDINLSGETLTFRKDRSQGVSLRDQNENAPNLLRDRHEVIKSEKSNTLLDIEDLLAKLPATRPVFHSEADFQHALAWAIHQARPDLKLRLEYRPRDFGRRYIDLCVASEKSTLAIELKYFTTSVDCLHDGERFSLLNQGAQDISRYDFLKDVQRLEEYVHRHPASSGLAIAITNDSGYWSVPRRDTTVDASFRLTDGRRISGTLEWAEHTGPGTMKGREAPISLNNPYEIRWADYSNVYAPKNSKFRYLALWVD